MDAMPGDLPACVPRRLLLGVANMMLLAVAALSFVLRVALVNGHVALATALAVAGRACSVRAAVARKS